MRSDTTDDPDAGFFASEPPGQACGARAHGSILTFDYVYSLYAKAGSNTTGYARLLAAFGKMSLDDITQDVLDREARRLHPDAKASTVRRNFYTRVRAIFNFAADRALCARRAFDAPSTPRQEQRLPTLHPRNANRIINACDDRFRPLFICLLLSGGHARECVLLRWEQLDFVRKRIRFPRTESTSGRIVPIHPLLLDALERLPRRDGYVFLRPDGNPYEDRNNAGASVRQAFGSASKRTGVKGLRIRDLHSIWATLELARNRDIQQLVSRGGWKEGACLPLYERIPTAELDALRDAHDQWLLPPLPCDPDKERLKSAQASTDKKQPQDRVKLPRDAARHHARLLTPREAACYCGLGVESFLACCPVPPVKLGNSKRLWRYDIKALDAWLDNLGGGGPSSGSSEWLGRVEKRHDRRSR